MLPLSETEREIKKKHNQEIYRNLEKLYFEDYRSHIISTSQGQYAVVCQKENGEKDFFLIQNNEFSVLPRNSICFLTIVGQEETFKEERLKRSKRKSKGKPKILDSPEFLHQYQVQISNFFYFTLYIRSK